MYRSCRHLILVIAFLLPLVSPAQFRDRLFRLLNGDSTKGPDHDTAYVRSYRDDLVISPVMVHQGSSLTLARSTGEDLRYATNTPVQYGLALDYKWLGIEYTATIAGLGQPDGAKGPTETSGLGFGYTGRRWWFRNSFRWSKGYHLEDPGAVDPEWVQGSPHPHRDDMESLTYMASLNHGFNAERYSHTAALWQMERQQRSAGSWTAGGTFWYTRNAADGALAPPNTGITFNAPTSVGAVRRMIWCVTGGYTHTFAFWKHGFLNMMLVPGLGAQQQRLFDVDDGTVATGWDVATTLEFRMGAGYVGDRWYAALSVFSYQSAGSVEQEVILNNGFTSARFAAGYRIKGMRPLLPALSL